MPEMFLDESTSGAGAVREKWREVRIERSLRRALAAALLAAGLMVNTPGLAQDKKPNILFVLMDNLGYANWASMAGEYCAAPSVDLTH
jgi:hypothetical protein